MATEAQRRAGAENGRKYGGRPKGMKNKATLIKEEVKKKMDQRFMEMADVLVNSQATLARGQTFLYKIEKTWVSTGTKKNGEDKGYWRNEKPKLVTAQWEIESYLTEIAENNGDVADDQDPGATYYFLTAKEPNNEAIKNILDRVHGKPKETVDMNATVTFSLKRLAEQREEARLARGKK